MLKGETIMDKKPQIATGVLDLIIQCGKVAEKRLEKATDKEEYAFLLGHINLVAALTSALLDAKLYKKVVPVGLDFNYDRVRAAYKEAQEETTNAHQISIEEFMEALQKVVEAKQPKKTTPKPKTTKKE